MTFSGLNSTGDPSSIWQLWYVNRTQTDPDFNDFMLVYDNGLTTDQVKASLVCANVSNGATTMDGLICAWEEGDYEGFTEVHINASGMWTGSDSFQAETTQLDTWGAGPSVGYHMNRILVVWENLTSGDIKWAYTDFTDFGLDLDVTIAVVPGQTGLVSYRYDPSLAWSYWGGHDKYRCVGTQAIWMAILDDTTMVWSCNLYTAPSNPGGGTGGGGGGGGGGASVDDEDDDGGSTCCGSASVATIIITTTGIMRTRGRRHGRD